MFELQIHFLWSKVPTSVQCVAKMNKNSHTNGHGKERVTLKGGRREAAEESLPILNKNKLQVDVIELAILRFSARVNIIWTDIQL